MAPILPLLLGVAALGGIAHASKGDKKQDGGFFGSKQEITQAVANALALETDPGKLRAFAASLREMGYVNEANQLEMKAKAIEATHLTPPPGTLPAQPIVFPTSPATIPVIPSRPAIPTDPSPFHPMPAGGLLPNVPIPIPTFVPPLPVPVVPAVVPFGGPPSFPNPGSRAVVTTQTDPLNLRGGPSTTSNVIKTIPRGSQVTITGPAQGGFVPVLPDLLGPPSLTNLPTPGFASLQYLGPVGSASPYVPANVPVTPSAASSFPLPGSSAVVTTQTDPLTLRSGPSTSAASLGTLARGSIVTITGPLTTGFYPVAQSGRAGFASGQYLGPVGSPIPFAPVAPSFPDPSSLVQPASYTPPNPTGGTLPFPFPGSFGIIATTTDPLNLRSGPSATATVIGSLPRNSIVRITAPLADGFYPVSQSGKPNGYASAQYIREAPSGTFAAGYVMPMIVGGASPSLGQDDVHQAALALDTALKTSTCRAFNEPVVRRFQAAAKRAGLYAGQVDGWYGTKAQAALGQLVGNPAPPCFPEPTGGPVNPNSYWAPNPLASSGPAPAPLGA